MTARLLSRLSDVYDESLMEIQKRHVFNTAYRTAGSLAIAGMILLAACSDPLSRSSGTALETDRGSYTVEVSDGQLAVDIPWQFTNPTDGTVYIVNCNRIAPPLVERNVDGIWEAAYTPIVPQCLSDPITIEPGETYRDTLVVRAGLPEGNLNPVWQGPIEGTFRLQWGPRSSYAEGTAGFGELLPLEQRVSNEFMLEQE